MCVKMTPISAQFPWRQYLPVSVANMSVEILFEHGVASTWSSYIGVDLAMLVDLSMKGKTDLLYIHFKGEIHLVAHYYADHVQEDLHHSTTTVAHLRVPSLTLHAETCSIDS